ncbi:MAG TPA: hypothetical protein VNZ58_13975 [Thermomicrobiales bacterium]|nr:hypothetical protein [Thermomicrobiales bacterium]
MVIEISLFRENLLRLRETSQKGLCPWPGILEKLFWQPMIFPFTERLQCSLKRRENTFKVEIGNVASCPDLGLNHRSCFLNSRIAIVVEDEDAIRDEYVVRDMSWRFP